MEEKELELEYKYLKKVLKEIKAQKLHTLEQLNGLNLQKVKLSKQYADDFYEMDDEEQMVEGGRLAEFDELIEFTSNQVDRLRRQEYSPYFGRIDFTEKSKKKTNAYYIGVNNLVKNGAIPLVCDWRAPVSSLFYDNELGDAYYNSPDGKVEGNISLKRQFEVKDGNLIKAFDSSLTIGDDILKNVLSSNATNKMKTIISTIQKEQNSVIRANVNKNMVVQGVAGSGKTSIALHRAAFLLYQNKNSIKAEDILILSPNKIFGEYISDVLPELGEENISQMSFYRLAQEQLKFVGIDLEKREKSICSAIKNQTRLNEVAYKHTYDFYDSLKQFCNQYFNLSFAPQDIRFGQDVIKAEELNNLYYNVYKTKTPAIRIEWLVDYIIDKLNIPGAIAEISEKIKNRLYPFFEVTNLIKIYANFLANIGMTFSFNENEEIKYEDIPALLYLNNYFFGTKKYREVKYLIIDEMQDYSFVAYDVFNSIFDCHKIVLGDINQCIEKIMRQEDLLLLKDMLNAELICLNKAYRSTYEITQFSSNVKNIKCEMFERHGSEPKVVKTDNMSKEIEEIIKNCEGSVAILTKDENEAKNIYSACANLDNLALVLSESEHNSRVCVMPSYLAKGLEFDVVIIPNYNLKNYNSYLDKNILYVSCTRALHELYLIQSL